MILKTKEIISSICCNMASSGIFVVTSFIPRNSWDSTLKQTMNDYSPAFPAHHAQTLSQYLLQLIQHH
jgi:hypothetical protein